jgi:YggT family protein
VLFRLIIEGYLIVILADVVLSYFPQFNRTEWRLQIKKLADVTCRPVRRYLPEDLPFDLSPLVVMILLQVLSSFFS